MVSLSGKSRTLAYGLISVGWICRPDKHAWRSLPSCNLIFKLDVLGEYHTDNLMDPTRSSPDSASVDESPRDYNHEYL